MARSGLTCTLFQAIGGNAAHRSVSVSCGNATYIMTTPDMNHIANSRQVPMPIQRWTMYSHRRSRRMIRRRIVKT